MRTVVGRHGARTLGGDLGGDRSIAVAQGRRTGLPRGVVERGLGPVLGRGAGFGAVVPGGTRLEEDGVGRIDLAVGRCGIDRGGRGAVALGVHGAHEEAVLAAARHLNTGGGGGGDRTIVAQDLVGDGVGDAFPCEGHGRGCGCGGAQQGRCLGRDVVAVVVAGEAAVPLGVRGVGVGEGEVAAHPQVAVAVSGQGPGTGLAARGQLKGCPLEAFAGGSIPGADPLNLVDARPGHIHGPGVHVLVRRIRAVAGTVDDALRGDGAGLQVAAVAEHHGTGEALVAGGVVAEQGVFGSADVHAVTRRGDGLLILARGGSRGLEGEIRVEGSTGLRGELGCVPGALVAVRGGEVAARVEGAVGLGHTDCLDGAADLRVPRAIGASAQGDASGVAGVDLRAAAAREVGEGTTQVDIAVVVGQGAHAHRTAAQRVDDLQVPGGVDLASRGVDDDGTNVGLAVDAGEVAADEESTIGQSQEGLDLGVKVEGLTGEVTGVHVKGGEATRGDLRTLVTLLDAGEVAAHVHGGTDLSERLHLDAAFLHGTVEVTAHAPRGLRGEVGNRSRDGGATHTLVGDARKGGRVRGDVRTHVDLGVGEDRQAGLTEEGVGRGNVAAPVRGLRAVTPTHQPARRAGARVGLQAVPLIVVAGLAPHDAGAPATLIKLNVDRVGHLERPHEVRHLRELQVDRLVGAARGAPGTHDAHTVSLILDRLVVEQLGDGLVGQLNDIEVARGARAGGQLRGIALAAAPGFPSFATAADHDPTATVCRLVTKELFGVIHRGSLEPVGSVRCLGIPLFNIPARRCGGGSTQTIMNGSLTGCRIPLTCTNSLSHRSDSEGSAGDNRRGCKDCKARKCGSHDTTFRR